MPTIELSNLSKWFGDQVALNNVTITFESSKLTALLGPSGCGKTTCLRCIAGLEKPDSGEILLDGKILTSDEVFVPAEKRDMGMVFQSYAIWPHFSVFDNIAYPLKIRGIPKEEIHEKVTNALKLVSLEGLEKRQGTDLSGGQQQRVSLARALIYDPSVLLFDEPLSNLDAKLREKTRFEIKELQSRLGVTTIYVTHDQAEALVMADTIVVIDNGEVVETNTPEKLYRFPQTEFVANFIGIANFIEGRVLDNPTNGFVFFKSKEGVLVKVALRDKVSKTESSVICIRPEDIVMSYSMFSEKDNCYKGKILSRYLLGNLVNFVVDVKGLGEFRVQKISDSQFAEDDEVFIKLKPERCIIVRKTK